MWLKQNARIVPSPHAEHAATAGAAVQTASKPVVPHKARRPHIPTPSPKPTVERTPAAPEKSIAPPPLPTLNIKAKPSEVAVISICPTTEDALNGCLFHGNVGLLLDNMLAAIRIKPEQAHKTSWVKTPPVFTQVPDIEQIQNEQAALQHEIDTAQIKAILFVGQQFEQAQMESRIKNLSGTIPYFILPHPARLLRHPQLKAEAWKTLKKIKQLLSE